MTANSAIEAGAPGPLGVTLTADGADIAVFSAHAERVELCLFDATGQQEIQRLVLPEWTDQIFHGHVPGLRAGQLYGLRAHGPWAPRDGHRFNPAKLLIDPYTKALAGAFAWNDAQTSCDPEANAPDPRDSAPFTPKSVVAPALPPYAGPWPEVSWAETIFYEAHVKGLTKLHRGVPESARGRYAGLAHPAVLEHLVKLGVTTVELMPVQAFFDELRLVRLGLANYWGYNPIAFMAPEPRYAHADATAELREAVAALHGAGLEVILDVVFNHTAETDELGPTLAYRGLDNAYYYRLEQGDRRFYVNDMGCGNCLDLAQPMVVRLVMDSLRHWATVYGIDGFRFDLGTALGRLATGFDPAAPLLTAMRQDPVLGHLKIVVEPWDIGPGGYRLGEFPPGMAEWSDKFRDTVRRFWRGEEKIRPELATRLLGSADLFEHGGRRAWASVNFIAAHDGFTTADVVAYEERHNEANGEHNRDGHGDNQSANHGVEGPSDDPAVQAIRLRQRRNLTATTLLAQGTPMLLMGDERGRSQGGNNNAYCQDNAISWWDWSDRPDELVFEAFTTRAVHLRRAQPLLRHDRFRHGGMTPSGLPDVSWIATDGGALDGDAWWAGETRVLGMLLAGDPAMDGPPLLLLTNAGPSPVAFTLPSPGAIKEWRCLLDTVQADGGGNWALAAGATYMLPDRSLVLLQAG